MSNDLAVACGVGATVSFGAEWRPKKNKASTIQAPDMSRMILCFTVHTVFFIQAGAQSYISLRVLPLLPGLLLCSEKI